MNRVEIIIIGPIVDYSTSTFILLGLCSTVTSSQQFAQLQIGQTQ